MRSFLVDLSRYALDMKLKDSLDKLPVRNGRCLSIGCGNKGRYHNLTRNFKLDGVDLLDPPSNIPENFSYYQCDAANLPFLNETYNLTLAIESFEHIKDNFKAMKEISRTLKKDGYLIMTTPTHWTWIFEFGRHGPHYYDKNAIYKLLSNSDLKVERIYNCGGLILWVVNLFKCWISYVFLPIFGKKWWSLIDTVLKPLFILSWWTEKLLPFLPCNWLVIAKKTIKT